MLRYRVTFRCCESGGLTDATVIVYFGYNLQIIYAGTSLQGFGLLKAALFTARTQDGQKRRGCSCGFFLLHCLNLLELIGNSV